MHAGALVERSRVDESYITSCGTWPDAEPLVLSGVLALYLLWVSQPEVNGFHRGVRIIIYIYLFDIFDTISMSINTKKANNMQYWPLNLSI